MAIEEYLILYETFCILGGDKLFCKNLNRCRDGLLKYKVSVAEILAMEHVVSYQVLLWIKDED